MILNMGSASGSIVQMGYTGAYAGSSQTYPYPVPYGNVDSNSGFSGVTTTENATWGVITPFQHATIDHTAGQAETPPYGNDINDHLTPESGYIGTDFTDWQIKYADGTTSDVFRVNVDIQEATTDVIGPVIDSVSVPAAGTYTEGQVLSFTGNWNEGATVTGTPAINFNLGGSARQANYASGTGTASSVFTYTVQAGEEDTDGITVTSLTLDGGTIKDAAGNDANLTLNAVGDTSGVLVYTPAPQVPQGVITFGVITKGTTSASLPVEYSLSDQGSLQYSLDNVSWQIFTSPLTLTALVAATQYTVFAKAVNSAGDGAVYTFNFTTNAVLPPNNSNGQYSRGKVTVSNGSAVVTGISTQFLSAVQVADQFTVAGDGVLYDVASINSDTQITLSVPYQGSTASGVVYTIARYFTFPDNFPVLTQGDIETPTILTRTIRKVQQKFNEISTPIGGYMLIGDGVVVPAKWTLADGLNNTADLSSSAPTGTKYIMRVL